MISIFESSLRYLRILLKKHIHTAAIKIIVIVPDVQRLLRGLIYLVCLRHSQTQQFQLRLVDRFWVSGRRVIIWVDNQNSLFPDLKLVCFLAAVFPGFVKRNVLERALTREEPC